MIELRTNIYSFPFISIERNKCSDCKDMDLFDSYCCLYDCKYRQKKNDKND